MQKSKLYGKLGKLIAAAVRAGGADAIANTRLREVLAQAKAAQARLAAAAAAAVPCLHPPRPQFMHSTPSARSYACRAADPH